MKSKHNHALAFAVISQVLFVSAGHAQSPIAINKCLQTGLYPYHEFSWNAQAHVTYTDFNMFSRAEDVNENYPDITKETLGKTDDYTNRAFVHILTHYSGGPPWGGWFVSGEGSMSNGPQDYLATPCHRTYQIGIQL